MYLFHLKSSEVSLTKTNKLNMYLYLNYKGNYEYVSLLIL